MKEDEALFREFFNEKCKNALKGKDLLAILRRWQSNIKNKKEE